MDDMSSYHPSFDSSSFVKTLTLSAWLMITFKQKYCQEQVVSKLNVQK